MKKIYSFIVLSLVLSFLGCQDTKEDVAPDLSKYKSIGEQIPQETAMRWLNSFKTANNAAGRENSAPYSVSASMLQASFNSCAGLVGMAFHHAFDNAGTYHILITPVDNSLDVWKRVESRVFIDANTGGQIDYNTAWLWTANYKVVNPQGVWFHFFGSDTINEIRSLAFFENFDIEPALNDANMPQLVLVIMDETPVSQGGRAKRDPVFIDQSLPVSAKVPLL